MKKRVLSALLAACLVLTMAPVAFAAEGDTTATTTAGASEYASAYANAGDVVVIGADVKTYEAEQLAEALNTYATAGDTVLLNTDATLTENVSINEAITLESSGSYTISNDASAYTFEVATDVSSQETTIRNIGFSGIGVTAAVGNVVLDNVTVNNASGDAIWVRDGSATVKSGTYTGTLTVTGTNGSLTISGGTFSVEPDAAYIADGCTVVANVDGTYTVQEATAEDVVVSVGETTASVDPDAGLTEAEAKAATAAAETVTVDDSVLETAANAIPTETLEGYRAQAEEKLGAGAIRLTIAPRLNITVNGYTEGQSLQLDITPVYTVTASNGVASVKSGNITLEMTASTTVTVTLPAAMFDGNPIYVNHTSGSLIYSYGTTETGNTNEVMFTTNGFSPFEFTKVGPVASVGSDSFADYASAMNDVVEGGTVIILTAPTAENTILVTKAVTLEPASGVNINPAYLALGSGLVANVDSATGKVTISAGTTHSIRTSITGDGTVTVSGYSPDDEGKYNVPDGSDITISVQPNTDSEVQSVAYTVGSDTDRHSVEISAAGGTFTAYDVTADMTVYATFVETDNGGSSGGGGGGAASYRITVEETEHGTVTVNRTSAARGTRVTITVDPDNGYALGTLSVTDRNGNEVELTRVNSTTYTFQMPNSRVTVSATFVADNTLPFTDVSVSDWFYEAVRYVYDRGLMNGITSTTFGPNRTTERGMIVTILYRLEGEPTVGASTFSDVASNFYYTDAIAWAAENDIVNGYPDGTFRPGQAITRQEMATILYRYASYRGYDVSASASLIGYTDAAQVGAYAADAMAWANATGLVTGTTVTTLTPTGGATRAQVATILMRFLNTLA